MKNRGTIRRQSCCRWLPPRNRYSVRVRPNGARRNYNGRHTGGPPRPDQYFPSPKRRTATITLRVAARWRYKRGYRRDGGVFGRSGGAGRQRRSSPVIGGLCVSIRVATRKRYRLSSDVCRLEFSDRGVCTVVAVSFFLGGGWNKNLPTSEGTMPINNIYV